jgi:hypothetical protein
MLTCEEISIYRFDCTFEPTAGLRQLTATRSTGRLIADI